MTGLIDLSALPAPQIIEQVSFASILADIKARLIAALEDTPGIAAMLDRESEPLVKFIEELAYRELLLRSRINHAAGATFLAHATGTDLDSRAADFGVSRAVITPADPEADPPVVEVRENDSALRQRVQLAFAAKSVAGPVDAYRFHALSADANVKDVAVSSPTPGDITVTILSRDGDGMPDQALKDKVSAGLTSDNVRPLGDNVTVTSPTIQTYSIAASLTISAGPDKALVLAAAEDAVQAYVDSVHRLGATVALSGLYAALHSAGAQQVTLDTPVADITTDDSTAAYCTAITISEAV